MARTVSRSVTGLEGISEMLKRIPVDLRTRILRDAVEAAALPIQASAKRYARKSVRTGALYASISVKTVTAKGLSQASATAIVGPSRDRFLVGGVRVPDFNGQRRKWGGEQPSRYAHLIEFGHAVRQPKKGTSTRKGTALRPADGKMTFVAPRPFMRPALRDNEGKTLRIMAQVISEGIEVERRRTLGVFQGPLVGAA